MPRRYASYSAGVSNSELFSTAAQPSGRWVSIAGALLGLVLKYGYCGATNPWQATGRLEWQNASPPRTENFGRMPVMDHEAYDYEWLEKQQKEKGVGQCLDSSTNTAPSAHEEAPVLSAPSLQLRRAAGRRRGICHVAFPAGPEVMSSAGCSPLTWSTATGIIRAFVAGSHQLNVVWGTTNTAVLSSPASPWPWACGCAQTRRRRGLVLSFCR